MLHTLSIQLFERIQNDQMTNFILIKLEHIQSDTLQ